MISEKDEDGQGQETPGQNVDIVQEKSEQEVKPVQEEQNMSPALPEPDKKSTP